ncbi:MAG: glycosyltransferase family 2 protein [Ilumatobacteraceae bacterium]
MTFAVVTDGTDSDRRQLADTARSLLRAAGVSHWVVVGAPVGVVPAVLRAILRLRGITCIGLPDDARTTNALADADWVCFLPAGERLGASAPRSIGAVAGADVVYGDTRHRIRHADRLPTFQRRPGWSPERLRHHNYIGPMIVARAGVARAAGARTDLARCDAHDRNLRITERASRIERIAEVVHETRAASLAPPAARDAVVSHLARTGIDAVVEFDEASPAVRIRRRCASQPLVSVLVPTRGSTATIFGRPRTLVVEAVRSLINVSTYANLEFVIVADSDTPESVHDELRSVGGNRLRIVDFNRPFNFAEKINLGAAHATGELFLLLNDDTEVISPDFLETLVALQSEEDVGLVGPTLLFEDATIQSAGHVFSPEPTDLYRGAPADARGAHDMLRVTRETSSIIAACALTSRATFESVGGLSVQFPGNWNDIDYCLKVWQSGRRVLVTPHARMHHFESKTRVPVLVESEVATLGHRWGHVLDDDPFFNPHLQRYVNVWKTDSTSPRSYAEALGPTAPIASK